MSKDKFPVVTLPANARKNLPQVAKVKTDKTKDKVQAKPNRAKAVKPAKRAAKPVAKRRPKPAAPVPVPDLSQVPAAMAPPDIKDTRPVPVPVAPTPAPAAKLPDPTTPKPSGVPPVNRTGTAVDTRLVQGATCTWIGPLEAAPDDPDTNQPVCPHCRGHLLTSPDRQTVELGLEQFELGAYDSVNPAPRPHPGYKGLVQWIMDRAETCYPTIEAAAVAYEQATGIKVDPSR